MTQKSLEHTFGESNYLPYMAFFGLFSKDKFH